MSSYINTVGYIPSQTFSVTGIIHILFARRDGCYAGMSPLVVINN